LEIFNKLQGLGEFEIWGEEQSLFFAPREVVYPSCQKKKDNHTRQQDVRKNDLGETTPCVGEENIPAEHIQSSKIFEDIFGLIDEWAIEHKTSWKYLKRKGFQNAEEFGDVIILNINNHFDGNYPTAIEDLKLKLKEKWGKIEQ
jgi:hypothetical protein